MKPIKLKDLITEDLASTDMRALNKATKEFAQQLIQKKLITTVRGEFSASNSPTNDYSEDLSQIIRNAIVKWQSVVNSRAGR